MVIRLYVSVFHNRGSLVSYYAGTYAHGTQYTAPFCNTSNLSAPLLPPVHFFQSKTTLYKIFCNSRSQFAVNNQLYGHGPSHFRWVWYASYTHWYEGYCNYRISHTMPAGGTDIIEINLRANCGHWFEYGISVSASVILYFCFMAFAHTRPTPNHTIFRSMPLQRRKKGWARIINMHSPAR